MMIWTAVVAAAIALIAVMIWVAVGIRLPTKPRAAKPLPPPPKQARLNWIGHWLQEDKRETLVRETAAEFAFLNQDIDLNLKFPAQILGVRSKPLLAHYYVEMIRSGNIEWDVIWMDDDIYYAAAVELKDPYWGKKHLVNFEAVKGFTETQKDFIITDPTYRNHTGGILVGPYIEGYLFALYYNKDVAKMLGLDIKQYGMTFNDLLGYVRKVAEYNQQHGMDIAAFYEAKDWTTTEIMFQNLAKSEIEDFREASSEATSPEKRAAMLKTFRAFEKLGKYHPLIKSYDKNIWFNTRDLVLNDQALFYINGTWMYSHWQGIDKEKMKKMVPAELPVFQSVDHYLGGYLPTWAVFKNAPHKNEAVKLVMFWSTPTIADKWVRYTKNPTGLRGALASPGIGEDVYEQFMRRITGEYGERIQYTKNAGYLLGKENELLQDDINVVLIKLLTDQISAERAYQEIMAKTR
jgi:ABC-type glycerol-3-phosphate transport system substrate-binding protein